MHRIQSKRYRSGVLFHCSRLAACRGIFTVADTGRREFKLDAMRSLPIASQRCDHRTDLLVTRPKQKRWRAPIAFQAYKKEIRFLRVRKLPDSVWGDSPTTVDIRIDQGREGYRRLNGWIERQPKLTERREVWPIPGRTDNPIDWGEGPPAAVYHDALRTLFDPIHQNSGMQGHMALSHSLRDTETKPATLGKFIARTAESPRERATPNRPMDPGIRLLRRQLDEVKKDTKSGMPSPNHERPPSSVGCPVAAEHVWHTVGNTIGQNRFAECRETTRTKRVRNSARGINHCAGEDFLLTVRRRYADHEWTPDPIIPSQLIAAKSGDSDDTMLHTEEGMDC